MNNAQQTARVGLFFLLGIALVWVTFETLSGGKILKNEGYTLIAGFESVRELKEGDQVRMAGVKIGEVRATRLAGRRAEAVLSIDKGVRIKSDATASIVMEGLIGTNYIAIDLGSANTPDLAPGAEIHTASTPDLNAVMKQLGQVGQKLEDALGSLGNALTGDGKNPGLVQHLDSLVADNRDKIGSTLTNLQQITDKMNRAEGTLGRLVNDAKLHDELVASVQQIKAAAAEARAFVASAEGVVDQVKQGKGAVGALVYDQKTADDLKAAVANLRSVSDKISRGEGTLGKLLSDDSLLRDAQAVMKKADRALDSLDDTGPITAVGAVGKGLF
jgi:phospholipid/cholesterol/gamma-HCH transport system substrate-binding protein